MLYQYLESVKINFRENGSQLYINKIKIMKPLTLLKEEAFQSENYIKHKPAYIQRDTTDDVHEINHIAQRQ